MEPGIRTWCGKREIGPSGLEEDERSSGSRRSMASMPTRRQKSARFVQQAMLTCWQLSTSSPVTGSWNELARPPNRGRLSRSVIRRPRSTSPEAHRQALPARRRPPPHEEGEACERGATAFGQGSGDASVVIHVVQSSAFNPGTFRKSTRFRVRRVAPRTLVMAAIFRSIVPMRIRWPRSRCHLRGSLFIEVENVDRPVVFDVLPQFGVGGDLLRDSPRTSFVGQPAPGLLLVGDDSCGNLRGIV